MFLNTVSDMVYRKFRIGLSKGWTLLVCLLTVVIVACSCRSKKVNKTPEPEPDPAAKTQSVRQMQVRADSLRHVLDNRMQMVVYGPPEILQRRGEENRAMREEIDSLENEIKKARQK